MDTEVAFDRKAGLERMQRFTLAVSELLYMLVLLPYFRIYERNTRHPISRIVNSTTEQETERELGVFFDRKRNEAQYVQVAGAIMFASVVSCLSWNTLQNVHWTGPAFWYPSIILSISAVVVGAQHSMLIPESSHLDAMTVKTRLTSDVVAHGPRPKKLVLFGWQCPLMLLSYSMVFFLAGMTSVVVSPIVVKLVWGPDAKTASIYLAAMLVSCLSFFFSSVGVHRLFTL